ncbi:MAG TPA: hypothetical protein VIE91_00520 [Methylophilaceae bacterium]|jgi:hypothetical protein
MSESEKLSIAAHLYVTFRRKLNRVIDVEWLLHNDDYAKEVIRIARQQGMEELAHYADRMEELIFGKAAPPLAQPVPIMPEIMRELPPPEDELEEDDAANASRYIGTLR